MATLAGLIGGTWIASSIHYYLMFRHYTKKYQQSFSFSGKPGKDFLIIGWFLFYSISIPVMNDPDSEPAIWFFFFFFIGFATLLCRWRLLAVLKKQFQEYGEARSQAAKIITAKIHSPHGNQPIMTPQNSSQQELWGKTNLENQAKSGQHTCPNCGASFSSLKTCETHKRYCKKD